MRNYCKSKMNFVINNPKKKLKNVQKIKLKLEI